MMKGIIIFIETSSPYANEKVFDGKSAVDLSYKWAKSLELPVFTISENMGEHDALVLMSEICDKEKADFAIISFNDLPFESLQITKELIKNHTEYKAEYTFSDGFPYGFAPEIIDKGILKILAEKIKEEKTSSYLKRGFLYELIKKDINSYEIETVLSDTDWRLFRFNFSTEKKENFLACKALYEAIKGKNLNAEQIASVAAKNVEIIKTLPGFYNIQLCSYEKESLYSPYCKEFKKKFSKSPEEKMEFLDFETVKVLIQNIFEFSPNAVISLSAFGECFYHPDIIKIIEEIMKYNGLCAFIETDALLIEPSTISDLKKLYEKYPAKKEEFPKLMIAVKLDSATDDFYKKIHPWAKSGDFEKAFLTTENLISALGDCVYPQFVRMQQNEDELETFFRFWNEKNKGNLIIQKYDNFAGLLKEYKVADLSPLERNVCWHIRRDMTILFNGDVPMCHSCVFSKIIGNIKTDSLEEIWKKLDSVVLEHINGNYNEKCRICDEYYTFNF